MANREKIAVGEYYHIYNRGVDKRSIVKDNKDVERFIKSLELFNSREPIISLRDAISSKDKKHESPLVEIICYDLNPNHFHLLLKEINEGGISEFMKRVGGGYTWYFNNRHKRSGVLFQGVFKSTRIISNEQLLHVSVYINLNDKAHKISGETAGKTKSSWQEYTGEDDKNICAKEIIFDQFKSINDYKDFAETSLKEILKVKQNDRDLEMLIGKHFY